MIGGRDSSNGGGCIDCVRLVRREEIWRKGERGPVRSEM